MPNEFGIVCRVSNIGNGQGCKVKASLFYRFAGIYKIKFYPWMTIVFITGYALVNVSVMYFEPETALVGFALFVAGLPFLLHPYARFSFGGGVGG